jgi:hypothetical protein
MDFAEIAGPAWAGWTVHKGLLYAPEWRRGLEPGEIRALPFLRAIESDHLRQGRELDQVKRQLATVARLAGWYRRQLVLESRFGLMLARIA